MSISICATWCTSGTRPAEVRWPATSPVTAPGRVAKAVLIGAVPPLMLRSESNPGGLRIEVFDSFREGTPSNRAQFFLDVASGPFYGFNRSGAAMSEGVIRNWWRQGMMGGIKAHYEGIKAFSETDFTEDLKAIEVPTLVMHGDDDQVVPIADSAELSIKLLKHGTLKVYPGYPARHVHHPCRGDQRRSARLHRGLTSAGHERRTGRCRSPGVRRLPAGVGRRAW